MQVAAAEASGLWVGDVGRGGQMMPVAGEVAGVRLSPISRLFSLPFLSLPPPLSFIQSAAVPLSRWAVFGVATGGFWTLVVAIVVLRSYLLNHYKYRIWRLIRTLLVVVLVAFVVRVGQIETPICNRFQNWGAGMAAYCWA